MKIIDNATKKVYEVETPRNGENKGPCPVCSKDRKKSTAKVFSFNTTNGRGNCIHCQATFGEWKPYQKEKEYFIPKWENTTGLTDKAAEWFRVQRGILDHTLNKAGVVSGVEFMPQTGAEERVICFPYYRGRQVVNVKYRDGRKNFKLVKDAELIFYNLDSVVGQKDCVITEGEIDCLSFMQAGVGSVISVPNGAGGKNMEYIDNCFDELEPIEKFYIAVDNDMPGIALKEELIRRLGPERCMVVNFGDCKDANEYLTKHGAFELGNLLKEAREVPIKDIINLDSIYDQIYSLFQNGLKPGADVKIDPLDKMITWELGRLLVLTGIPGHGKSEVLDFILTRLNMIHGWKIGYFSPENFPIEIHYSKLASKIAGKSYDTEHIGHSLFEKIYSHIRDNFYFIYPEEDLTIDNILINAKTLVRRRGIKVLVIDPYNKLEHSREAHESETEYISRVLDRLSMFAKQNECLVCLVAHPRKMNRKKDSVEYEIPNLYDINGSANFYNKADYGMVIYRDRAENNVKVQAQKVKFKHLGEPGEVVFEYNAINGRLHLPQDGPDYDNYLSVDWHSPAKIELPELKDEVPF